MKNVYLIQNSKLGFELDIAKLYQPSEYNLLLIINESSYKSLKLRQQNHFFKKIWLIESFDFCEVKNIIEEYQTYFPFQPDIVTIAEECVIICGQLRVFFRIDEYNADRFKNKLLMKALMIANNIPVPKHLFFDKQSCRENPEKYIEHLGKKLSFPLIAKPIDAMGCINIRKLESIAELWQWSFYLMSSDHEYEIDEFINGKVYNCDSFIRNKEVLFTQVSECSNSCYDFMCGMTKGTIALPHNEPIYELLCSYTFEVHKAIKTPLGGVTHLEIVLTEKNEIFFLEIAHRPPGILIPAMYKKFLNLDLREAHILLQINPNYKLQVRIGDYCAWIAFPIKLGKLNSKNIPKIESSCFFNWNYKIGDSMTNPENGRDYAGDALIWHEDYTRLRQDFYFLSSFQFYDAS